VRREAAALWIRFAASTAIATATVVAVDPPRPGAAAPWPAATAIGLVAGVGLFAVAVHRWPWVFAERRLPRLVTVHVFLAVCAVNEELVWRRLVLGETLRSGVAPAVALSAVGFALAHRTRRWLHLLSGGAFGVAYVATGSLCAPVVAHWTYNALVAVSSPAAAPMSRPAEAPG
jgi:membrane protease YdiL (CAAX protease family)